MPHIYKQTAAKQDLVDIWLYTYRQWGETQADKYLDDLEAALHLLAEQPLSFSRLCASITTHTT